MKIEEIVIYRGIFCEDGDFYRYVMFFWEWSDSYVCIVDIFICIVVD